MEVDAHPARISEVGPGPTSWALVGKHVDKGEADNVNGRILTELYQWLLIRTLALCRVRPAMITRKKSYPIDCDVRVRLGRKGGVDDGQKEDSGKNMGTAEVHSWTI